MDLVGADNAADVEPASTGAGSEISFEQVLKWQPEVIITDTKDVYDEITTNNLWKDIKAVKNNEVYQIPNLPYSIISAPPSVNRICGIVWLGNLLYPEIYNMDVSEEVNQFYKVFYHYDGEVDIDSLH